MLGVYNSSIFGRGDNCFDTGTKPIPNTYNYYFLFCSWNRIVIYDAGESLFIKVYTNFRKEKKLLGAPINKMPITMML